MTEAFWSSASCTGGRIGKGGSDPKLIGYARVSTDEQSVALRLDVLRGAGCEEVFQTADRG
jgi:hypothetical protein